MGKRKAPGVAVQVTPELTKEEMRLIPVQPGVTPPPKSVRKPTERGTASKSDPELIEYIQKTIINLSDAYIFRDFSQYKYVLGGGLIDEDSAGIYIGNGNLLVFSEKPTR